MRHKGLHMEWSHIWSLLNWNEKDGNTWMDDSTQDMTWWLEMVKIARKGFEVLSKGEGQATVWQPKNLARVKKEVLAFSWGNNQTMMVILKWRIKSWMNCLSDLIHFNPTHICCLESSHMLKKAMLKEKIKFNMLTPSLDEDWKLWHLVWRKSTQATQLCFSFDLE